MNTGNFFAIIKDPKLFVFKKYNLVQTFYVSFREKQISSLNSAESGSQTGQMWLRVLILFFASFKSIAAVLRLGFMSRIAPRILFFGIQSNRHIVEKGKIFDLYNARIVEDKSRDRFIIVQHRDEGVAKQYRPDLFLIHFEGLVRILRLYVSVVFAKDLRQYSRLIGITYPELGFSQMEIEKLVIGFYAKFLVYRFLVTILLPERVLILSYYGKEAFIAACKSRDIRVTELMHGLITSNHPYYNYPVSFFDTRSRLLVPDDLAVYGEYWRQVAIAGNLYPADKIKIIGYYLRIPSNITNLGDSDKTMVLVTSQAPVQQEIRAYLESLKTRLSSKQWCIIIKPHPRENSEFYRDLLDSDLFSLSNESVYELLTQADVHISVFSTVLFEAVRYDIANYVLFVDKVANLCDEIVYSGVALLLESNEIPDPQKKVKVPVDFYFADYNPEVLFE